MVRHRITDEQWECLAGVFPPPKRTGRPRSNLRNIVDAIMWILCTGSQWRDFPQAEFGAWETAYCWFHRGRPHYSTVVYTLNGFLWNNASRNIHGFFIAPV